MVEGPTGFTATVRVPWQERVLYKFVVDGRWTTIDNAPTDIDWSGNVNNVYNAPTKPYEPPVVKKPEITPAPAPIPAPQPIPAKPREEEPVKDSTPVVVPVNDPKPVDTPPAKVCSLSLPSVRSLTHLSRPKWSPPIIPLPPFSPHLPT